MADSLYNTAVSAIARCYSRNKEDVRALQQNIQFDVFYSLYSMDHLSDLSQELCDLAVFTKMLEVHDKRALLHRCFQAVMDSNNTGKNGQQATTILVDAYTQHCTAVLLTDVMEEEKCVQLGFSLAGFLSDAGWHADAEKVYMDCLQVIKCSNIQDKTMRRINCSTCIMHERTTNYEFASAETMWQEVHQLIKKNSGALATDLHGNGLAFNRSRLYSEVCSLRFSQSLYDEAYKYCCLALKEMNSSLPPRTIVDVFCQCSKLSVLMRDFRKAEILVKYAVQHARDHFGSKHLVYSDALQAYAFYLRIEDDYKQLVHVNKAVLDIRSNVFRGNNLQVAIAHLDLAHSSHSLPYQYDTSGIMEDALHHAEMAVQIINRILPPNHFLFASNNVVVAGIIRDAATNGRKDKKSIGFLQTAGELHLSALPLIKWTFGEDNLETAMTYSRQGRLYHFLGNFEAAEKEFCNALRILDKLFGQEHIQHTETMDYLADLYNHALQRYKEAEELYQRSIALRRKVLGDTYKSLRSGYVGLIALYDKTGDSSKVQECERMRGTMDVMRAMSLNDVNQPLAVQHSDLQHHMDMKHTIDMFLEMTSISDIQQKY